MRRTSVSRPHHLVCPACEYGALRPRGPLSRSVYYCESCWCSFGGATVGTLKQIAALPDAVGKHACEECGQPEMRSLADGTFYCPACRSGGAYHRIQPLGPREPRGRRRRTQKSYLDFGQRRAQQGQLKIIARGSTQVHQRWLDGEAL
jgi:ribosomal protein L37AE/L43A